MVKYEIVHEQISFDVKRMVVGERANNSESSTFLDNSTSRLIIYYEIMHKALLSK